MIASLSWGIRSAFPNLNLNFFQGGIPNISSIPGIFSSCSGGKHDGGGLFGTGEASDDAPSAKGYERVFTDEEMKKIYDAGFPQTDEDHGIYFGMYESEQKMQGNSISFELKEPSTSEDKRIVGKFGLIINGEVEQEGYLCYCGHSIYSLFDRVDEIDNANSAAGIWYVSADGKSLSIYDNGEEKMKWTLKE